MRCCTFKSGNSSCSLLHPLLCSMTLYNIAFIKHDTNERNNQLQVYKACWTLKTMDQV
ncbi:hypothetical protein F2P79_011242 [Pimephales promelas]|nr:hypothetical protein F2P79_011242 [Pimephales promelas]